MHLSFVFVFVAFALLTSASPIDDYSQRSDSLWKRIASGSLKGGHSGILPPPPPPPPPSLPPAHATITYRDGGMVIIDELGPDGNLVRTRVKGLENRELIFSPEGEELESTDYHLNHFKIDERLVGREVSKGDTLLVSVLIELPDGKWRAFHAKPPTQRPAQYPGYTTISDLLSNGGYKPLGHQVLLFMLNAKPEGSDEDQGRQREDQGGQGEELQGGEELPEQIGHIVDYGIHQADIMDFADPWVYIL